MWRRKVKKISIILSTGIFSLIIIAIIFAFFLEKPITEFVLKEINKTLKSEISVEKINFSFLKRFPYATIELKNLTVKDAILNLKKDTLFKAESVKLHFNIFFLIKKEYVLNQIEIAKARINLRIYCDKSDNYHFWKPSTLGHSSFYIDIRKISFKETHLNYINYFSQQSSFLIFKKLEASGRFSDRLYSMKIKTEFVVKQLALRDVTYVQNKDIKLNIIFDVNNIENKYTIKESSIRFSGVYLTSSGNFIFKPNQNKVNIIIEGQDIPLQAIQEHFPEKIRKYLSDYDANVKLSFKIKAKGIFDKIKAPLVLIDLLCKDGSFTEPESKTKLQNINFIANFTNSQTWLPDSSIIEVKQFSANIEKSFIESSFTINNFVHPVVNAKLKANIDIPVLSRFINMDSLQLLEGNANIALEFNTNITDFYNLKPSDFQRLETKGIINITKLKIRNIKYNQLYENISTTLDFDKKDISITSLKGNIKGSDFEIQGHLKNFFPYLFFQTEKLFVNAKLFSSNINLDDLLIVQNNKTKTKTIALPDRIIAFFNIETNQFAYKNFFASNAKTEVAINTNELIAQNVKFNSMDGTVEGYISLTNEKGKILMRCMAAIENVDVSKLFYSFNNFGQNNITNKHIKGIVKANIHYQSLFDSSFTIIPESILSKAELTIENGELNDYKPLLGLSKYIKVEELKRVQFSTLINTIEIKNRAIYFPEMEIKSTALNMQLAGKHMFTNEIDYHIKLLLSEILSNKRKKNNIGTNEFGIEKDDGLGKTTIFLHITGTVDEPLFKYDSKNAVKKVFSDLKNEKNNLKNIFKNDSIQIEKQQQKLQENGKFIIKWDENSPIEKDTLNSQKKNQNKSNIKIEWE